MQGADANSIEKVNLYPKKQSYAIITKVLTSYVFDLYFRLLKKVTHFLIFLMTSLRKTSDTLVYGKNSLRTFCTIENNFFHMIMLLNIVENEVLLPFPLH